MLERRKKEIKIRADEFRRNCRVIKYGIANLFDECEPRGYKLIRCPLGEKSIMGFVQKREGDFIVFTNSSLRLSREIFTLAHELGHICLHMETEDGYIDDEKTIGVLSENDKEQEANFFAACLLMPEDMVGKYLDLEKVECGRASITAFDIAGMMTDFGVSFEMVLNRLKELGKINEKERSCLDNEKSQMRVGNLLKCIGGNRELNLASQNVKLPREYMEWVLYNYNHKAIPIETLERGLRYYNLTLDDVRERVCTKEEKEQDLDVLLGGMDV